jgi:hypothetical protein
MESVLFFFITKHIFRIENNNSHILEYIENIARCLSGKNLLAIPNLTLILNFGLLRGHLNSIEASSYGKRVNEVHGFQSSLQK